MVHTRTVDIPSSFISHLGHQVPLVPALAHCGGRPELLSYLTQLIGDGLLVSNDDEFAVILELVELGYVIEPLQLHQETSPEVILALSPKALALAERTGVAAEQCLWLLENEPQLAAMLEVFADALEQVRQHRLEEGCERILRPSPLACFLRLVYGEEDHDAVLATLRALAPGWPGMPGELLAYARGAADAPAPAPTPQVGSC